MRGILMVISLLASLTLLSGCDSLEGSRGAKGAAGAAGATGAAGAAGADVDPATVDSLQSQIDAIAAAIDAASTVEPESCAVCHKGVGEEHQAVYDDYVDTSFAATVNTVTSVGPDAGGDYAVTVNFTVTKDGQGYTRQAANGRPDAAQFRMYAQQYNAATRQFLVAGNANLLGTGSATVALGAGVYETTYTMGYAPEAGDGFVYLYIADEALDTEGMTLYADVANAGKAFGALANAATDYDTYADVSGCEKCHGAPYRKHGYRAAEVSGLPDFVACKVCHLDDRNGTHPDWQVLVDVPARYAELHLDSSLDLTATEEAYYGYKRNVMNDVHMSHAMEFPYPQSMANCATCHEGQMAAVTADANFESTTCKSCHPVTGPALDSHRAPALQTLWDDSGATFHSIDLDCNNACHNATADVGPTFGEIHTGYNSQIYADAAGTKYSDIFTITIDDASLDATSNALTIDFSAAAAAVNPSTLVVTDIAPTVYAALYGYDTKDFVGRVTASSVSGAAGVWQYTADLSNYAEEITAGTIRRIEIGVRPRLQEDGVTLAVDAPSRTFDIADNDFDDGYFDDIVDVAGGCNNCHDALATTFHSPDRGGNIRVCRMCHVVTSGGSHLELQSRSIDSYVHAIHSFQAFDSGDVDFTDAVERTMYELHVEHTYPNFTIKNCESCHNADTYEVPDQSKSLPGLHSGSDTWNVDRNIGTIDRFVTGPASRACGGCHRAEFINEDDAGGLAAWHQHVKEFGYMVDDATGVLDAVTDTIMAMFE